MSFEDDALREALEEMQRDGRASVDLAPSTCAVARQLRDEAQQLRNAARRLRGGQR